MVAFVRENLAFGIPLLLKFIIFYYAALLRLSELAC